MKSLKQYICFFLLLTSCLACAVQYDKKEIDTIINTCDKSDDICACVKKLQNKSDIDTKLIDAIINRIEEIASVEINDIYNNYKHIELAELAEHVYSPNNALPYNWALADNLNRKIETELTGFNSNNDGFHAEIYFNKKTNEYALVFRGSELQKEDWITNVAQAIGYLDEISLIIKNETDTSANNQYKKGVTLARILKSTYDSNAIFITGHSLGGGIAALAGLATGLPTYTYNAAAVNIKTITANNINFNDENKRRIRSYIVEGDALQFINAQTEHFGTVEIGEKIILKNVNQLIPQNITGSLLKAIGGLAGELSESLKNDDSSTLKAATGLLFEGVKNGLTTSENVDFIAHSMSSVIKSMKPDVDERDNKIREINAKKETFCNAIKSCN